MNRRQSHDRPVATNGFTLIEMIAVIAIIGMVFAIGIPRLTSSKLRGLRTEAESIATSLEFARQRAIMTGITHRLLIDLEEGGYRIEWPVDADRAFAASRDAEFEMADFDECLTTAVAAGGGPPTTECHQPTRRERAY